MNDAPTMLESMVLERRNRCKGMSGPCEKTLMSRFK
jgi:hypothetical protein